MHGLVTPLATGTRRLLWRLRRLANPATRPTRQFSDEVISATLRADGWGKGTHVHTYPYSGVALLNSFYFLMTDRHDVTSRIDHHLERIMVVLDHDEQGTLDPGTLRLGFDDIRDNDEYRYVIAHHAVQGEAIGNLATNLSERGIGSQTITLIPADRPSPEEFGNVFVLRGFHLAFEGKDHHIKNIGIRLRDGRYLDVDYNDRNSDDAFLFEVQYSWVPTGVLEAVGSSAGSATEYGFTTIQNGRVVLRGFHFSFQKDHHIKEFGVLGRDGRIDVVFSDKNGDDVFSWLVEWGLLSRDAPGDVIDSNSRNSQ